MRQVLVVNLSFSLTVALHKMNPLSVTPETLGVGVQLEPPQCAAGSSQNSIRCIAPVKSLTTTVHDH